VLRRTPAYTLPVSTSSHQVGEAVRREREAAGLSLSQLSALTGISKAHLVRLEKGEGNPSLAILSRIAQALDLTVADLVGRPKLTYRHEDDDPIPASLQAFADEANLSSAELRTLASIKFREKERPQSRKRWRFIYDSLVASRAFDPAAGDDNQDLD
jgi:transcriptional regulator with XRE-family HTH domain